MENKTQKNAFLEYEADAWFERNKKAIESYSTDRDRVVSLLKFYKIKANNILEIGCSAGYRLNGIADVFGEEVNVFGIDPSSIAIEFGKKKYPRVDFTKGTADNLSEYDSGSMDVVIVGFVFYIIDREIFFKTVSEIDRIMKNGGVLIIVDFFSEAALKNVYEHIKDFKAYTFKQNYDEIFTASKLYYLLDKSTWSHSTKELDATDNYFDKYSISLLKKDIHASYK